MKDRLAKIADKRLLRGAIRLVRLIKSNAPTFVKCNEVALMHKFLPLYGKDFAHYMEHLAEKMTGEAKNDIGICCERGCRRPVDDPSPSRGYSMCSKHRRKVDLETEALDKKVEEFYGSQEPVED